MPSVLNLLDPRFPTAHYLFICWRHGSEIAAKINSCIRLVGLLRSRVVSCRKTRIVVVYEKLASVKASKCFKARGKTLIIDREACKLDKMLFCKGLNKSVYSVPKVVANLKMCKSFFDRPENRSQTECYFGQHSIVLYFSQPLQDTDASIEQCLQMQHANDCPILACNSGEFKYLNNAWRYIRYICHLWVYSAHRQRVANSRCPISI